MEKEYFIKINNENLGPYTLAHLCKSGISEKTFVSVPQDNTGWRMAKDIPELQRYTVSEGTITLENLETSSFYLREGTEIRGPYSLEELSILGIEPNSFVGINNPNRWYYAESVTGLLPLLAQVFQAQMRNAQHSMDREPNSNNTSEELFYVSLDGENFGPYNMAGLKGFGLFESTLVRKVNEDLWRRADTLPELQGHLVSEEPTSDNVSSQQVDSSPNTNNVEFQNPTMYDMTEDFNTVYEGFKSRILALSSSQKDALQTSRVNNPTRYSEEVFEMALLQYNHAFTSISNTLQQIQNQCNEFEKKFNEDIQALNNLYLHKTVVSPQLHQQGIDYQEVAEIDKRKNLVHEKYENAKSDILQGVRESIETFYRKNPPVFIDRYEIATTTEEIWHDLVKKAGDVQKRFYVGNQRYNYSIFGENIKLLQRKYPQFLNGANLILHYDGDDKQQCLDIVNTLIGRAMMCIPSGGLQLAMIDTNEMNGTSEEWKRLNRNVFRVSSRSADVLKMLDETVLHIEHIIQNLLKGHSTLAEYNMGKENQEPYRLLVIEDFPIGIPMEGINNLKKIFKNGIRAGVTVILMVNEDEIKRSEDALKAYRTLGLEQLKDNTTQLYWPKEEQDERNVKQNMIYNVLPETILRQIVNSVNKGFEVKTETVMNLSDYLPDRKEWWTGTSASMVEIPFGMSTTKNISQLRITQESGQNSAIVIGIPGSGKSVFLHSVIVDAAVKYSPEELQMYLLDFSGVEFNTYANHKLPHARVIAPEAEREFGLSVLRELKEEGARRMTLCRENDVTSIVQYRKKNPNAVMPRLLVIIDEFQKIFEIENDAISKEANSIIHIIIQEYRKFGINLLLATQRIPSSAVLPRDLIANRVVFKSAPNDFSALISWQGNMMPNLRTGQCIYNAESGAAYANEQAQGFYIPLNEVEKIVDELNEKAHSQGLDNKKLIVFRGNDQPDFKDHRLPKKYMVVQDIPEEVPVLLGQSIAISDTDVCAIFRKESSNNLLVIGGDKDVAQKLILHASLSATLSHTDDNAQFFLFNFMRPTDPQYQMPTEFFAGMPFPISLIEKVSEVKDALVTIKNEIEARKQDENRALTHIYLSFFAFQLGRVFDRGGRRGDDVSEEGQLLDFILKQGPSYGIFTLLQVDKIDGVTRIGTPLTAFRHRVVMQISENESTKLMDSPLANRLFVMNRPSSKFRAFYRDQDKNVTIKFKPYK